MPLYLNEVLGYSEDDATEIYHGFTMMVYLLCIFGAMISDFWLGKFKTILYFSIVYAIGTFIVSVSGIPSIGLSPKLVLWIGLTLISIGSGGIKPCVATFGGDQFKLPEQAAQLATYFSLFFLSVNFGSFISTIVTPILRSDVHCFGKNDCYSLAFGVPAILMIVATGEALPNKLPFTCHYVILLGFFSTVFDWKTILYNCQSIFGKYVGSGFEVHFGNYPNICL